MCGYSGIINSKGLTIDGYLHKRMDASLRRLSPRGPDQQDKWFDNNAYLVHARLSILDTSEAGKQPFIKYNKVLVYNGEIYNFIEIREDLIRVGYSFNSNSDCEVLLAGWDYWGENILDKLDGMFSFAIWDIKLKKLILARDPFGKKPLLYSIQNEKIYFSSELKSLEKILESKDINITALESLFRFRFIHEPLTIYKQVEKLPAGHIMEFKDGNRIIKKWYNISLNKNPNTAKYEVKKRIKQLFDDSVSKRLIADVPIGVLLSGGLDSSLIIAALAERGKSLSCYTMGFENASNYYEERHDAKKLANYFGMKHYDLEISSRNLLSIIPEVFDACDEPFADSSALPFYALSKEISKNITVALSGDGGDEVFGGYRKYIGEKWAHIGNIIPMSIRKILIRSLIENKDTKYGEFSRRLKRFLSNISSDKLTRNINWLEQLSEQDIYFLLGNNSDNIEDLFINSRKNIDDDINAVLMGDLQFSLVGDMLVKLDRMSMANSLEIRSPFLDKKLVEYAFSLPGDMKVGFFRGKKILRDTFSDRIPTWSLNLPKKGFEIPIANWLQTDLKKMLEHVCTNKNLDKIGIKNYSMVDDWKNSLYLKKKDTSWQLWTLMSYYYWSEPQDLL